jgi:hypothetical protein
MIFCLENRFFFKFANTYTNMSTLFTERLRPTRMLKPQLFIVFILLSLFFSCKKRKHSLVRNLSGKTFELVDYKAKLYYEGDSSESISGGIEKLTFAFDELGGFITATVKLKDSTHIKKKTSLRYWMVSHSNIDLNDSSTYSQEFSFTNFYQDYTDYKAKELNQWFYFEGNSNYLVAPSRKKNTQLIFINKVPHNQHHPIYPIVDSVIEIYTFNQL